MQINYLQFGEKGLPLVFLHGWQQNSHSFLPLVNFFYKDYRLFFLDLPGFGKSEKPPDNFSSFDYARVITDWLRKKNFKKIILIGHSFGGKIAAIISSQNPSLVSKLVLIGNSGLPYPSRVTAFKRIIPKFLLKKIPTSLKMVFASRDYKQAASLLPVFKTVVKENISQKLAEIKISTLIIWGKDDQEIPLKYGQKMQKLISKSKLVVVDGDHFPFWQNPQKTANIIKEFLKK